MSRQSVGVVPFKHIIKWLYPTAVEAFDGCAAQHDKDYKTVDWSCEDPTVDIDLKFYGCCLRRIELEPDPYKRIELREDAEFFYEVCRKWGRMRAALWKVGIRY